MASYDKKNPDTIQTMFDSIANKYDFTNGVLSLQLHRYWNQKLISSLINTEEEGTALADLCCGTGDIAFRWLKKAKTPQNAKLIDFSKEMLECAKTKAPKLNASPIHTIKYIAADVHDIPLEDKTIDYATMAYGIRNVYSPEKCFQEVYRILKNEGKFGILELTRPSNSLLKFAHKTYLQRFLPIIGKMFTSNKEAYRYLSQSIDSFIQPAELQKMLMDIGFKNVKIKPLSWGVATIIIAEKI